MNRQHGLVDKKKLLLRQVAHWTQAAARLQQLEDLAAPEAWRGLDEPLARTLRESLLASIARLHGRGHKLIALINQASKNSPLDAIEQDLSAFRKQYFKVETTVDFFTNAINTRTNPEMSAMLRACDYMAEQSMRQLLQPLGYSTPPAFTYITQGRGASILKKDIKLWDRETSSPVAAIKIVRHNLLRPTSLIHESGHQVAHLLNWNKELGDLFRQKLGQFGTELAEIWASWASEIAADTYAFVHTGYAAVTSLHDILIDDSRDAFRFLHGDPHPINYLRVRLNIAFCRVSFGLGHWDELESEWNEKHPISEAPAELQLLLESSIPLLHDIARLCLEYPLQAFRGRSLSHWLSPDRVAINTLEQMARNIGPAMYNSNYWIRNEALRLLAYHGYRLALEPENAHQIMQQQRNWVLQLGNTLTTNHDLSNYKNNKQWHTQHHQNQRLQPN